MRSLLDGGGTSRLNPDENTKDKSLSGVSGGTGTVLAAAARIERGALPRVPSP